MFLTPLCRRLPVEEGSPEKCGAGPDPPRTASATDRRAAFRKTGGFHLDRIYSNDMEQPSFDPGLRQKFTAPLRRVINKDGTFHVHRRGATWRDVHPYLYLINMSWPGFLAAVFFAYIVVNTLFATAYFLIGVGQLQGGDAPTALGRFLNAFFFSAQPLSTVGCGALARR